MALRVENKKVVWVTASSVYPLPTAILALVTSVVSYLAARLGGALVLFPQAFATVSN